ncbi:MAG: hypothetical protein KDB63_06870 [Nocardioidaceae bacterium]|nr:hypothetical protein [Nocardioidaceae bacterium]
MTVSARPTRLLAGLLVAVGLATAGCTGEGDEPPSPSGSAVTSNSSGSPTTASSSAGPVPASGPWLRTDAFELRAPQGWSVDDSVPFSLRADELSTGSAIYVGNLGDAPDRSLDDQVAASREIVPWTGRPHRLADITLDGVAFYHLVGEQAGQAGVEEFGAISRGTSVRLSFNLGTGPEQRAELIDSVLATFAWVDRR